MAVRLGSDRRAVSDTLGFVLVFALIVTSVGVVYTVGFSGLQDARDFEQVNNAERAFEVFAENVEDLRRSGVPSRATEVKLSGATLRVGTPVGVNVTADYRTGQTDPDADFSTGVLTFEPLVYDAEGDATLRYVNGAVVRSDGRSNAIMVREPNMLLDDDRFLVPVMLTRSEADGNAGGETTAYVRTVHQATDVVAAQPDRTYDEVRIEVFTPYPDVWAGYFEGEGLSCTTTTNSVACTQTDVEGLYTTIYRIAMSVS
jgi:hypothetical protein